MVIKFVKKKVRKSIFILPIMLGMSCFPIKRMNLCKCNLEIETNLRTDGVYLRHDTTYGRSLYEPLFLYRNGVLLTIGLSENLDSLKKSLDENKTRLGFAGEFKSLWGCYSITGTNIHLQSFGIYKGPQFQVFEGFGRILNDTTFIMDRSKRKNKITVLGDSYIYRFHKFSKPDSVNWLMEEKCKQ